MLYSVGSASVNDRLWYPQLDMFECIRRFSMLINSYETPAGIDRLYIVEFYLANPTLIHLSSMKREVRAKFNRFKIAHPRKQFLSYPAPAHLFRKVSSIQHEALRAMSGKGILDIKQFQRGLAKFSESGKFLFNSKLVSSFSENEKMIAQFLTQDFSSSANEDLEELQKRTGLRRLI